MKKESIVYVIACLMILLFAYTGISKLMDARRFETALEQSPIVGVFASTVVWLLPVTELVVVALLFFERTRRIGLWASVGLMGLFTLYLLYMILFTPHLP